MKTREFDIKNYNTPNIMMKMIKEDTAKIIEQYVGHEFLKDKTTNLLRDNYFYSSAVIEFDDLTKKQQKRIINTAKETYEVNKAESVSRYKAIRKKCDSVFYDDKTYQKLVPELDNLYYCQAYTMLDDFMDRKRNSKAVSNSRFQARLLSYSEVSCD